MRTKVNNLKIDKISFFMEKRGNLMPFELQKVPFAVQRIFIVNQVPAKTIRGGHAHKETLQYAICVSGAIKLSLHDGRNELKKILPAYNGIFINKMIWGSYEFLTGTDTLLVLCSTKYEKRDYISDFELFKKLKQ